MKCSSLKVLQDYQKRKSSNWIKYCKEIQSNMTDDPFCHCGSCGHEKVDECYTKQCTCCLTDHQGSFGKNR
jgi:hypothetical protein